MTPTLFLSALRWRLDVFLLALGTTVAAATVLSLVLPPSYRATVSLVVDRPEEQSLGPVFNPFMTSLEEAAYIQTQADVIKSPRVARKVVDNLDLAERPSLREAFEEAARDETIENWIAAGLLRALDVETSESSVIDVTFEANDASDAAAIANAFAQAYTDTMLELRVQPAREAAVWFDEQLRTLRANLESAQTRMTGYQQQHSIVSLDSSLDEEYIRLDGLAKQLLERERQTAELEGQQQLARQILDLGTPLAQLSALRSELSIADSHVQQLIAGLLDSEARLQVLATRYGANHPDYRRELAANASRRAKLDDEMRRKLAATEHLRDLSRHREEELEGALAAQQARILDQKNSRDALTVLSHDVVSARAAYDAARQRFVTSQVESRASQADVARLSPAVAPAAPYWPKPILSVVLAVGVGTLLGAGLAVLREATDRRVRSIVDLVREANVPALGELTAWAPSSKWLLSGPSGAGSSVSEYAASSMSSGKSRMRARNSSTGFLPRLPVHPAAALLGLVCGAMVALGGLNGLYLCLSLVAAALILYDFRAGVVLLILLMPISGSHIFPHEMLGITGLNPLNLLLVATLGSYLLQASFDGSVRRFLPTPLLWLYIVPILVAGALGSRHVGDMLQEFYVFDLISFNDPAGYLRDMLAKPLLLVVFALLIGAAASRSKQPQRFLIPTVISVWVMGLIVIVFVRASGVALDELGRATSRDFLTALGMHANELGRLYAMAYALLLFTWAQSESQAVKVALLASMGVVVAALLLTFSRSAFVGVIIVNALYLLWHRNVRTITFLGVLAVAGLLALPDVVYERITYGFADGLDAISAGRVEGLWMPLAPEVLKSPLYGTGLGSTLWSEAMRTGAGTTVLAVTHPHNAYLQTLLDMGFVGLALVGAYYVHVWRRFRSLSKDPALSRTLKGFYEGAAAGLLVFLVAAVADGALTPRPEQAFLWLAIGMMYGQMHRSAP